MFLIPMDAPGRRDPADPADERSVVVQRGLPVRCAGRRRHAGRADRRRAGRSPTRRSASSAPPAARRSAARAARFEDLLRLAHRLGKSGDPVVRQQLADVYVRTQLRTATTDRVARAAAAGAPPGPAASIGKLVASAEPDAHRRGRQLAARSADRGRHRRAGRASRGPSMSSARPATGSRAALTRSSATSSASVCSACPGSRASTRACRTRSCRAAPSVACLKSSYGLLS